MPVHGIKVHFKGYYVRFMSVTGISILGGLTRRGKRAMKWKLLDSHREETMECTNDIKFNQGNYIGGAHYSTLTPCDLVDRLCTPCDRVSCPSACYRVVSRRKWKISLI